MNSEQAKKIDLPVLMSRLGFQPVKMAKAGKELWYLSPFRNEATPSFHTSHIGGKWIWNDFGDEGGNVIDFIMRLKNVNFKEALRFLREMNLGPLFDPPAKPKDELFSFQQQSASGSSDDRQLEFIEAHEIRSPVIFSYLKGRGIPENLARAYLVEVKYWNHAKQKSTNKPFFAFGMQTLSGYEIRAASDDYSFKSALIARDVSLIHGREGQGASVNVFEGMTDFLSLLVLMGTEKLKGDAIVMHSLSSFQRVVKIVEEGRYNQINTFLDNNPAGQKGNLRFLEAFPEIVTSYSDLFAPHIDLNDALRAGAKLSFSNAPVSPSP